MILPQVSLLVLVACALGQSYIEVKHAVLTTTYSSEQERNVLSCVRKCSRDSRCSAVALSAANMCSLSDQVDTEQDAGPSVYIIVVRAVPTTTAPSTTTTTNTTIASSTNQAPSTTTASSTNPAQSTTTATSTTTIISTTTATSTNQAPTTTTTTSTTPAPSTNQAPRTSTFPASSTTAITTIVASCAYDAEHWNSSRQYMFVNSPMSWYDSQQHCECLGGHLAYIYSEADITFLANIIPANTAFAWIGITDLVSEGTLAEHGGAAAPSFVIAFDNSDTFDCAIVFKSHVDIHVRDCEAWFPFICEHL